MLRILHYADIERIFDYPDRIGRLAGLIQEHRTDDTLVLGSGDNTAPGVLPLLMEGRQAFPFFSTVDPDADTLGNHEFDYGIGATERLVAESSDLWVCSNLSDNGAGFGPDGGLSPYKVVETDSYTIGVYGVANERTGQIAPAAESLAFQDPVTAARRATEDLKEQGVDYVIGLVHRAKNDDIAKATDTDVILGGHMHYDPSVKMVDGTLTVRPYGFGRDLVEIRLTDPPSTSRHDVATGPQNDEVADTYRKLLANHGLHEVITHVDQSIKRDLQARYVGESRVGNFIADAFRRVAGTDIGFINSGSIGRGPPLQGAVTRRDVISLLPFDEPVVVLEVSGKTLREAFEQGAERDFFSNWDERNDVRSWHAHVSGCSISYDFGSDELLDASVDGNALDDETTYTVATSRYVAQTNYIFSSLQLADVIESLDQQYEVLLQYSREEGIRPRCDGRIQLHR